VLIVGSVNVDLVVSVALLPTRGETVTGGTFSRHFGGKGANQAVAAARLGAAVTFVGAVGADEFGEASVDELRREGIDVTRVAVIRGDSTGLAMIVVDHVGENQIAVASGANSKLESSFVEQSLSEGGPAGPGAYLANLEVSDSAVIAGARYAAQRDMTIIINPAPARELPVELLALRPILVPNQLEAEELTGERDPMEAARLLSARTGNATIITAGRNGAVVFDGDRVERIAPPYVNVVDTTGAGDAFAGALAAELARGATLQDAARVAVRAATESVTERGARTAMPTRAKLGI
jgi:ribokinase